jgi:hypothetical protein
VPVSNPRLFFGGYFPSAKRGACPGNVPLREVLGSRNEVLGSLREALGSLKEVPGSRNEVLGSLKEVLGSLKDVLGSLWEEFGSLREALGSLKEVLASPASGWFALAWLCWAQCLAAWLWLGCARPSVLLFW